jgi:hypothetical protein
VAAAVGGEGGRGLDKQTQKLSDATVVGITCSSAGALQALAGEDNVGRIR